MKTTEEKIAVMQAWVDGLDIEYCIYTEGWSNEYILMDNPSWDWVGCDYRIKQY